MVNKEKLVDGNLSFVLHSLLYETAGYGEHSIIIYPELDSFREIYRRLTKDRIEKHNDFVMLMPHYETTKSVEQSLAELDINVKEQKSKGALDIVDSYHAFFDPEHDFLDVIAAGVDTAKRNGKSGLVVIADMGSFYHRQAIDEMVDHECKLASKGQQQDMRYFIFCCYHKNDFEKLTKDQEERLCINHYRNLSVREGNSL